MDKKECPVCMGDEKEVSCLLACAKRDGRHALCMPCFQRIAEMGRGIVDCPICRCTTVMGENALQTVQAALQLLFATVAPNRVKRRVRRFVVDYAGNDQHALAAGIRAIVLDSDAVDWPEGLRDCISSALEMAQLQPAGNPVGARENARGNPLGRRWE